MNYKSIIWVLGLFTIIALIWVAIGNFLMDKEIVQKMGEDLMFKKITTNLMVEDVNKSVEYYEENFGFEMTVSVPDTGKLDFAIIQKDEIELMFQSRASLSSEMPAFKEKEIGQSA